MILTAMLSILMKMVYLFTESLKFRSAPFDFHIIFPLVVHGELVRFSMSTVKNILNCE